jgi:phenylacetaldehyde dehydrogenase
MSVAIAVQPQPSAGVSSFLRRPGRLLIGGEWVDSKSSVRIPVMDPATGAEIATVADANAADVDRAVAAARAAFESGPWATMLPAAREALLWRLSDLIQKNADELAELESLDNGKTKFMASVVDVPGAVNHFRYMAGWATKIEGSTIEVSIGGPEGGRVNAFTRREPVGVVAQIIPWNFPLVMAAWKLAPALAVGCTCVLKPAEQTPLTALRLGELIIEAGFPPGVLNILTGSTAVGKLINKQATDTLKRVSLELGGKSPVIVLPDADASTVIGGAAGAIFFNAGQVCAAGSRLYVHRKIFDQVVEGVGSAAQGIKLGPGLDPATQMGPLVSREQQDRVLEYIESGRKEGASIVAGGEAPSHEGYFVKPTVMADVKRTMRVVQEEIFGPVLVAQRFDDINEVAALANDTQYGLGASIWSNDLTAVHRLIPKIRAGTIWVNVHGPVDANMPFGGFKHSGLGREHGRVGIEMYTELKSVCMFV